jgi:hypothetical protein
VAKVVKKTVSIGSNRRFAMPTMKPLALGIFVWATALGVVQADPITWPTNLNWVAYFAGQDGSGGNSLAQAMSPPATSAPQMSVPVMNRLVAMPVAAPAPAPVQAPAPPPVSLIANAPVSQPTPVAQPQVVTAPTTAAAAPSGPVDAFINLGNGPYPLASVITTGGAQPWFNSSQINSLFGGTPSAQQIQSFDSTILARVQQTFSQSGVSVTLTDNPGVAALHTLSLVSNTQSASLSNAIGMTQVGANGFSFIDNIAPSAQNLNQLEWIVAHNVSHELMLAFGVPENYDQTGNFVDAKVANWSMMISPTATFSPAAAQALNQALATQDTSAPSFALGAQEFSASSVPEPAAIALWTIAGTAALVAQRIRARKNRD